MSIDTLPAQAAPTVFDAKKHLAYQAPVSRTSLEDLKLPPSGLSPLAVTAPFPLFSREGVIELRREILSHKILNDFTIQDHVTGGKEMLAAREFNEAVAPFIFAAWKSPEVLAAVSEAAQVDLVPVMDLDIGHTNFQITTYPGGKEALYTTPIIPPPPCSDITEEERAEFERLASQNNSVVGFHRDSYPFVCVVMLSDASAMIGGETALKCGDGSIARARGPAAGQGVIMQGRYIEHAGLKAYNSSERIAMVTSFRPRNSMLPEQSVLNTVRPVSSANRLNYQWTRYRLNLLSERFAQMSQSLLELKEAAGGDADDFDGKGGSEIVKLDKMKVWFEQQVDYINHTANEWKRD